MKPYIVKFNYLSEDAKGKVTSEEMFLCLHAKDRREAFEKYLQVTGGESRQSYVVSVTGQDKIEAFWSTKDWKFFTIPQD
jgi:hypothetical protein